MQKIMVIGCSGAGKSTLSVALAQLLDLPVIHLDKLYWKPGWKRLPKPEFLEVQRLSLQHDSWLVDGNYGSTLELRLAAADTIIFLDYPTHVCLWGALNRWMKCRLLGHVRLDMSMENLERIDGEFLWWILSYRTKRRPGILQRLEQLSHLKKVVLLRNRAEAREFVNRLRRSDIVNDKESDDRNGKR